MRGRRGKEGRRERKSQADSPVSTEPEHDLKTLRSGPES